MMICIFFLFLLLIWLLLVCIVYGLLDFSFENECCRILLIPYYNLRLEIGCGFSGVNLPDIPLLIFRNIDYSFLFLFLSLSLSLSPTQASNRNKHIQHMHTHTHTALHIKLTCIERCNMIHTLDYYSKLSIITSSQSLKQLPFIPFHSKRHSN